MKKLLRHRWRKLGVRPDHFACEKCGCERYWDFDFGRMMYRAGVKTLYRAPDCIAWMNGQKPYNEELVRILNFERK